ncbi:MAG: hypothetical protein ABI663_24295, partial [Chryseolinea sp.]
FSFSEFVYSLIIQLHQVSLNVFQQLRMAEPLEEAEEETWGIYIFFFQFSDSWLKVTGLQFPVTGDR